VADGRVQVDARAIENLLYHRLGLLGVSGISSDTRTLLESDDPAARSTRWICFAIGSRASSARWRQSCPAEERLSVVVGDRG
jgi:acetate kinase